MFEVISAKLDDSLSIYNIINIIKDSALDALGSEYPKAGIRFLKDKYNPNTRRGILRANNKYAKKVVEAINKSKDIKTLRMSGILRKIEKRLEVMEIKFPAPSK